MTYRDQNLHSSDTDTHDGTRTVTIMSTIRGNMEKNLLLR